MIVFDFSFSPFYWSHANHSSVGDEAGLPRLYDLSMSVVFFAEFDDRFRLDTVAAKSYGPAPSDIPRSRSLRTPVRPRTGACVPSGEEEPMNQRVWALGVMM